MKLKLDENQHVVVLDGKPVYVTDDGKDIPFDAPATVATITRLNNEAKTHREAKEAAETRLKTFEGIEDAEAARKALETLKNIEEGKLIAAGKVEEIKAAAARAAQEQVAAQAKTHTEELNRIKADHDKLQAQYHGEKIGAAFAGSTFVKEKTLLPASAAQKVFGDRFKVEEGNLVAYYDNGNQVFSRSRPGELAKFDEAIEILVGEYPDRDFILKGNANGGGGARGANGLSNADLSKLSPVEKMNIARQQRT